jgi:O-antigen/teichoic acid export membrane protein
VNLQYSDTKHVLPFVPVPGTTDSHHRIVSDAPTSPDCIAVGFLSQRFNLALQATGDPGLASEPNRRGIKLSGYISTAAISAANILAVIAVTAILARAWDEDQFLLYGKTNRYLNFLFCITNGSLGYAIVRYGSFGDAQKRKRVLFNALCLIGGLTLAVAAPLLVGIEWIAKQLHETKFSHEWVIPCVLWLFAQSFLHIILAHLRSSDQLKLANKVHWTAKTLCILSGATIVFIMTQIDAPLSVPKFYGLVGILVTATCTIAFVSQWNRLEPTLDPRLCGRMLEFSSTRVIDAMLRTSFLVVVITMLGTDGPASARIAGQIAVITFLLRGIEALCQPLVMLVMTDSLAKDSNERVRDMIESTWIGLAIFTIPIMAVLVLFCKPIVSIYLTSRFQGLAGEFGIISLSLLPTVAVVLFRGHLDGKLKVSPIMYANIIGVVAIGATTWFLIQNDRVSLRAITWSIVVIRWVQFAFVMWLLRRNFDVSLYRHSTFLQLSGKVKSLINKLRKR